MTTTAIGTAIGRPVLTVVTVCTGEVGVEGPIAVDGAAAGFATTVGELGATAATE